MGGTISVLVATAATVLLFASGWYWVGWLTCAVTIVCLWSTLHMWYFARLLARNRQFVEALDRGDFEMGSPEANRFWREMRITLEPMDARDVPDWITRINTVATCVGFTLFVLGLIAYF